MAKLHEYTSTSRFSGYYIYGVLNQEGHTTIQVSTTAKQLFDHINIQPGETIPDKLLRALLDAGLLYTGRRRISQPDVTVEFDTEGTRSELSKAQFQLLLQFIQSYDGPSRNTVKQLARSLELNDTEIPESEQKEFTDESSQANGLAGIVDDIFDTKREQLRKNLGAKLQAIPGNATINYVDDLTDGWELLETLLSSEIRILGLDVLDEHRIRYQIDTPTQTVTNAPSILTIIQNTARLTNAAEFTIIADRSVHLPPSREFEISHRIQIKNGRVQEWILSGKITSHVQTETAIANLKGERDQLFRQLQTLTNQLPIFTFTQSDPYETELKYELNGVDI